MTKPTAKQQFSSNHEDAKRKAIAFQALMVARARRGCTETQFRVAAAAVPPVPFNWAAIEQMQESGA